MRVSKIKIKNLFGIKEYEAGAENQELSGKNGVGKSSVIDAIRYALTNKSDRDYIVRNGETEGEILIETDTGLMINRKARINQSDYKSVKKNGMHVPGPESFLRDIITPLQLSPMEFMEMDKKQQNATILDMIDYPWTLNTIREWFGELPENVNYDQNILAVLNEIQAEDGVYFQTRQDTNRMIRAQRAIIEEIAMSLPIGYNGEKWEKVNLGDLYSEIEKIRRDNEQIETAKRLKDGRDGKIRKFQAERDIAKAALDREMTAKSNSIDKELAALQERMVSLEKERAGIEGVKRDRAAVIDADYEKNVARYEKEIAAYADYISMEPKPIEELMKEASEVEKMKAHVNEWRRKLRLEKEVEGLKEKSALLTQKIEKARTLPGEILEKATIPIEGLTVKNGIPLINGLPVSNLSDGEKLDLCVDVAVQSPAGLQIILIDGVEKLSAEMRNRLYRKCKEKGLQFISTRTTDEDELTVYEL